MLDQISARIPIFREVVLETEIPKNGMALCQKQSVVSVLNSWYLAHGIYLGKFRAFNSARKHCGLNYLMRDVVGQTQRID